MYSEGNVQFSFQKELLCRESSWGWIWKLPHCLERDFSGPPLHLLVTTVTSSVLHLQHGEIFSSDILTVTNILLQIGPQ